MYFRQTEIVSLTLPRLEIPEALLHVRPLRQQPHLHEDEDGAADHERDTDDHRAVLEGVAAAALLQHLHYRRFTRQGLCLKLSVYNFT